VGAGVAGRTDVESIEGRYLAAPSLIYCAGEKRWARLGDCLRFLTVLLPSPPEKRTLHLLSQPDISCASNDNGDGGRCAKFKNGCRMPQLSRLGITTSRLAWSVS
jgi:hypothetical protein